MTTWTPLELPESDLAGTTDGDDAMQHAWLVEPLPNGEPGTPERAYCGKPYDGAPLSWEADSRRPLCAGCLDGLRTGGDSGGSHVNN